MANMIKDYLAPDQAKLLDDQLRQKRLQQGVTNYGNDPMGRFLTAASGAQRASEGFGMAAERAVLGRQKGPTELRAIEQQKTKQAMIDAMKVQKGKTRVDILRNKAEALRNTGDFNAIVQAEQLDTQADELQLSMDTLNVQRIKAANAGSSGSGVNSTEGEHFADEAGNQYATVLVTDRDAGTSKVNYIPLGNAPEYDGTTPLKAVIKSGSYVGLDPLEAAELEAVKQGDILKSKDFNVLKVEAAQNYSTAKQTHSSLIKALELTKQAADKGLLEGGIQANLQNAYYNLTGKRPKTLGELNMIFNETTFARLKPLFGSNISNGERESVQDTYTGVLKGGDVNIGVIEQLIGKANGAMFNYNVLMSSDSYEDWTSKLTADKPTNEKPKNVVKRLKYNPKTGKLEEME